MQHYLQYASAKYVVYDLASNTITEQAELGAIGYYYIFPTITVDKDNNIAVTYTRTASTEYAGAYYSTKYAGDPPGLGSSQTLVEGLGNYQNVFQGRNRWGDYLGIYLDPADENNMCNLSLRALYIEDDNRKILIDAGVVVITVGGGGIPVIDEGGDYKGLSFRGSDRSRERDWA